MNEKELARFYEHRRDDASLWEEKPSKANVRHSGSVVFSLRISPDELTLLRETAESRGMNVSELVRRAALREATRLYFDEAVRFSENITPEWCLPLLTAMLGLQTSPLSCGPAPFGLSGTEGGRALVDIRERGFAT